MGNTTKRLLSFLFAFVMVIGLMPVNALQVFAAEEEVASYNGTGYSSLEDALDLAEAAFQNTQAEQIVTLTNDLTVDDIVVPYGVKLDCNSKEVTVTNLLVFGSIVNTGDSGKLHISGTCSIADENSAMPVYSPEDNAYILYSYAHKAYGVKANGSAVVFGYAPKFNDAAAYDKLVQGGKLGITFRLTWTGCKAPVEFVCSDELMAKYGQLAGKYFGLPVNVAVQLSVTGTETLYNGTVVTVTPVLKNELGAEVAGEAMRYVVTNGVDAVGETFGFSQDIYRTTMGVDLANDKGANATIQVVGGAPQYAYLHDVFTDKFSFETEFNVSDVLNEDNYPKFGLQVNGASEMVKFFVDMKADKTAENVGVVYQPTGGGDDWGNAVSKVVSGMSFTGSDTVKLKLIRDGKAYYFYVNDSLVHYNKDGFKTEKGAVGIFSFNAKLTASKYKLLEGDAANDAIQAAKQETHVGENFGSSQNTYITTDGVILDNDKGQNATIQVVGGAPQYAYLKDKFTDKFSFETEFNVTNVLNNDSWPKFGLQINGASEMVKFFVDMTSEKTADKVGVVYQPTGGGDDWGNAVSKAVSGMSFTGSDTVKLKLVRDGKAYFFYVNDNLVLYDANGFQNEKGAVGVFSFNTELTASKYTLLEGDAANGQIAEAVKAVNFFTNPDVDLSKDYGANVGTVSVNTGKSEFITVKDFNEKDFYFETKVHVNEVYNGEDWPKFGIFAENESKREIFFVDMNPQKQASVVGRMTSTKNGDAWADNWDDLTTATVDGMKFAGDGEYVTLALKKEDGRFFLYVNGEFAFYHDSAITDKTTIGIFGFNTGMELKEYFVNKLEAPKQMLKTNNGQQIDIVQLGRKIWTTRDYVFTSMPEAFIGKPYVKTSYGLSGQTVDVTVQKSGYLYVLTNAYKTDNSQAETLDELNYTKLDMAGWKFCDFTGSSSYIWVYEKYVEPGETLKLGQWSVVIASETKLNLESDTCKTADSSMAVLKPAEGASVGNMELGAKVFANREYTFEEMPYWLAGKNYILGNYGQGSATAVRGGYVYMLTNTGNSGKRVSYLENNGYTKVNVPAFTAFTGGDFDKYEFVVYRKSIAENETVSWPSWAVPIFSGDLVLSGKLAKITPDGTTVAAKYDQNVRLFNNRTYFASGDKLTALHGKSYLYASFEEGGTGTVTTAGTVYVQIPVKNSNSKYVQLEADLIAAGYTPAPYRLFRNNTGVPGKSLGYAQKLYQKEVAVGDTVHFGQYNIVYFDTLSDEEYYEMPSVTVAAKILNNPKETDTENLGVDAYDPADRNWQGCPVVTVTAGPNGTRMWAAWFTGGNNELAAHNCAVLMYSDDNGMTWYESAVAVVHPDATASVTKPQLWTLDDGRLWVSWTQHTVYNDEAKFDGRMGTWAAICENPGASVDQLRWSEPVRLFEGRGNGKITVLNRGQANEEWLTTAFDWIDRNYSKVYSSTDKGVTWTLKGKAEVTGSTYNNAILTERKENGESVLWMLLRQLEGNMKESFSYDGGVTWTNAQTSHIEHPNSAIYVGWTSSGKLLMINHKDFTGRNNLTAFLSEDGGKTWPYTLLLDARSGVSYPDVIESNGALYVVYDYDRFNTGQMYMAKITEADIMAGNLVTAGSYLKRCFGSMGINGPQVGTDAVEIDLSDKVVSASTEGAPARDAFDKNTDTRWCATSAAVPQWLQVDLKDVYNLESVYVFFEQKSEWDIKVETSLDGNEWTVYSDPGAQKIIDVTINQKIQARYVRLTVESTTGGAWASVWEMEIYANKDTPNVMAPMSLARNPEGTEPTDPEGTEPTDPEGAEPADPEDAAPADPDDASAAESADAPTTESDPTE